MKDDLKNLSTTEKRIKTATGKRANRIKTATEPRQNRDGRSANRIKTATGKK